MLSIDYDYRVDGLACSNAFAKGRSIASGKKGNFCRGLTDPWQVTRQAIGITSCKPRIVSFAPLAMLLIS